MADGNSFWMDTMLPAVGTGLVSTASNLGIMALQNKFNAEQAQIARDWNLEQDNTKYQRTVTDMMKAGVNPALAMKGGITTQAASNIAAQGATPAYMNMNAVASLAQSISQAKLNDAERRNLDSKTLLNEKQANYYDELGDKTAVETVLLNIDAKYHEEQKQLEMEGQRISNSIGEEQIKEVKEKVNKLIADTQKSIAEAKTEEEKQKLIAQEAILKKAQAYQIYALVPFHQNLMAAQSESARAAAKVHMVEAAFKKGLIDAGAIEAEVRRLNANASESEIKAITQETLHNLGYEGAQVSNIKSETANNTTRAAANVINSIASLIDAAIPF